MSNNSETGKRVTDSPLLLPQTPSLATWSANAVSHILEGVDTSPQSGTIQSFKIGNYLDGKSNHFCQIDFSFEHEGRKLSQPFYIVVGDYDAGKEEFEWLMERLKSIIPYDLKILESISYHIDRWRKKLVRDCAPMPELSARFIRKPNNEIANIGHATDEIWLYPLEEAPKKPE